MPHDKNGKLLKVGDVVNVTLEVKEIFMAEDYCNVTLTTLDRNNRAENVVFTVTCNAKQVEKK